MTSCCASFSCDDVWVVVCDDNNCSTVVAYYWCWNPVHTTTALQRGWCS